MRRRTVQPEIRSFVSVLRYPVTPFDRSDEEWELFRRVQRIYVQRKCELSAIQEGSPRKRCKCLARKIPKLFANTAKVHILARKSVKLIANFSATKVTSLPSHSLSLSFSLYLSLSLSPSAPHAQYRKHFRASYNTVKFNPCALSCSLYVFLCFSATETDTPLANLSVYFFSSLPGARPVKIATLH